MAKVTNIKGKHTHEIDWNDFLHPKTIDLINHILGFSEDKEDIEGYLYCSIEDVEYMDEVTEEVLFQFIVEGNCPNCISEMMDIEMLQVVACINFGCALMHLQIMKDTEEDEEEEQEE